jgi:hypothetical protein
VVRLIEPNMRMREEKFQSVQTIGRAYCQIGAKDVTVHWPPRCMQVSPR